MVDVLITVSIDLLVMSVFVLLTISLVVSITVCSSVCLSLCMSVCLFVCLSVCLSVCLFVCLSVCLSVVLFSRFESAFIANKRIFYKCCCQDWSADDTYSMCVEALQGTEVLKSNWNIQPARNIDKWVTYVVQWPVTKWLRLVN